MKRFLSLSLVIVMIISAISLASCGAKTDDKKDDTNSNTEVTLTASEVYANIWAKYTDDEKSNLSPVGGDLDHSNMEGPDVYDIEANAEGFASTFLVDDSLKAKITTDVVTLMNMMNANTFCSAVMVLNDANDAADFAEAYKALVQGNMWMCGAPETVVVISYDKFIIVAYGEDSFIQSFKTKTTEACEGATVLVEDAAEVFDF